jgi:adenosylcobinamide-phosphate synthase
MSSTVYAIGPLYVALMLDLSFGDPPNRLHPVAWMGKAIAAVDRCVPRDRPSVAFLCGAGLTIGGVALAGAVGLLIERGLAHTPPVVSLLAAGLVLKMTISIRGLARAAQAVRVALEAGDLVTAREQLRHHLVSRETSGLDATRVAAATVESVAENASDAIIAPLAFYALAGLPGALAYRFLNTADSMLGYHGPKYEWFGKVAARLDDMANLIPARLTALLMIMASPLVGGSPVQACCIWWRDAGRTTSPNAGHPMSVAAGVLGIELEKVGVYRMGSGLADACAADIGRATRLVAATTCLAAITLTLLRWMCQAQ